MEIQLEKTTCHYLRQLKWESQAQEQTQELRLPDGMPDIGNVLGAWGQVLIRGKEWYGSQVGVSGGVMCWVMYAPEDGSRPQMVEAWLPFQMKWDIPDSGRDGTVCVRANLRHVDGRNTSARKLMVRATAEVLAQIWVPDQAEIIMAAQLPPDIEILKNEYPMELPMEAGEKTFEIDESLRFPASVPEPDSLICYQLQPEVIEHKLLGDKAVFRGMCILHLLYRSEQGQLHTWDFEIPFSQYSELDRTYDTDGQVRIVPAIAGLELDREENGNYRLKASVICQYLVSQRSVIQVVEDVYSPRRPVTIKTEMLQLPAILWERAQTIQTNQVVQTDNRQIADVTFCPTTPRTIRTGDQTRLEMGGRFQLMCQQPGENPEGFHVSWEDSQNLDISDDVLLNVSIFSSGLPGAAFGPDGVQLHGDLTLELLGLMQEGIPMVAALESGEVAAPDPNRPSLILRKPGEDSLWTLAKKTGSTMEAIRNANALDGEPASDQILLIPVS